MSGWNLTGSILIINLKCAECWDGGGPVPSARARPAPSVGTSLLTPQAFQASPLGRSLFPTRAGPGPAPPTALPFLTPCLAQLFLVFLVDRVLQHSVYSSHYIDGDWGGRRGEALPQVTAHDSLRQGRNFRLSSWSSLVLACPWRRPSARLSFPWCLIFILTLLLAHRLFFDLLHFQGPFSCSIHTQAWA